MTNPHLEDQMSQPENALFELDLESEASDFDDDAFESQRESVQVEETDRFSVVRAGNKCYETKVLSAKVWPEFKTEWPIKCVLSAFGKCRLKTKVPVAYKRISKLQLIARVCVPSEDDLKNDITECIKGAVMAGVIAGVGTGSVSATAAALKVYLMACLAAKGVEAANDISVGASIRKEPGRWKKV